MERWANTPWADAGLHSGSGGPEAIGDTHQSATKNGLEI